MIYIVCDMNCNNFGNYFRVVGHEREVIEDTSGYVMDATHYPKGHCYRSKLAFSRGEEPRTITFPYSEAINQLIPKDYVRWQKTRFGVKI